MFKNFANKRFLLIGVGLLVFILIAMYGNSLPVSITPKLPSEISSITQSVGFSDNDVLKLIRKYLSNQTQNNSSISGTNKVTRIIDGDTIEIDGMTTVRYIGINAPEKYSNITQAECWNEEAMKNNSDLVLGKDVRLEKDVSETDKYGRLLRYVFVGDVFINEELIKSGSAYVKAYPPDLRENERLVNAEIQAKTSKVGFWGECL